jgi:hypothetical protein
VGALALILAVLWRSRPVRVLLASVATVGLVGVAVLAWWLTPFEATDVALAAMESDEAVVVASATSEITMTPQGPVSGTGLVFYPGARVDARAYANILRPLAEKGHQVVIVKEPLGVAFLASDFAPGWAEDHPGVHRWAVAGHSLGGVVAAQNASALNTINDLVLWASFPGSDLSDGLFAAMSVFGTNDGLTTTSDIEESKTDLPSGTLFEPVEGAVHSFFGDYGAQPGDGDPGVSRTDAQAQIVGATLSFLEN